MDLPNVDELGKIIDLCRKKGVDVFELPGKLRLELGDAPVKPSQARSAKQEPETPAKDPSDPWADFPTGELDPEQLMFFSSGGKLEDFADFQRKRAKQA